MLPNFELNINSPMSALLVDFDISDFHSLTNYVKNLAYGKNEIIEDLSTVLAEKRGDSSTKHAFLVQTARENDRPDIQLALGFYEMSSKTHPEVSEVLKRNNLQSIPEAYNYILFEDNRYDFTKDENNSESPFETIKNEMTILPNQIIDFKLHFHRFFIINWLKESELGLEFDTDKIWEIRKECLKVIYNNH